MSATSASTRLRCHRCGSTDLLLTETGHEHAIWDSIVITDEGALASTRDATFAAGEMQTHLTRIECLGCGRNWKPRRHFTGAADTGQQTSSEHAWDQCPHEMFWGRCVLRSGHDGEQNNDPAVASTDTEEERDG